VRKLWIIIVLLAVSLFIWWRCTPIAHPPGKLVSREPEQVMLAQPQASIAKDGWTLEPLAVFSLDARVLGVKFYKDDFSASIAPCDLALGWGPMSDTAVLERMDITQHDRIYRWRFWGKGPLPAKELISHSANMHIIPADESILSKLKSLRKGSLVHLSGNLVVATHPKSNKPWRSSLTRDDEGEGACELFYVKSLTERESQ
jgi:hypothetical protein